MLIKIRGPFTHIPHTVNLENFKLLLKISVWAKIKTIIISTSYMNNSCIKIAIVVHGYPVKLFLLATKIFCIEI